MHSSAVIATLTSPGTSTAGALLAVWGFRPVGQQAMVLARIDHEEHYYANQTARALRDAGITVEITDGLQKDIDTEWTSANYPLDWLSRDEIREVSAAAQEIHDDIASGRLTIHQHAHDGWTTVAVGTYQDGTSVHLHGENHLRQVVDTVFDAHEEAIAEFGRLNGDAVRPGPAPATPTEQAAADALTDATAASPPPGTTSRGSSEPRTEVVPVYAADPGDHEALLESFLEEQGEWEKYRTWDDDSTIANHESLTLRAEFLHEAERREVNWTVAAYESPVGERLWHATATAGTPVAIVHTLLEGLASHGARAAAPLHLVDGEPLSQATWPLTDAGWQQTINGHWINWSPPNNDAVGVQFDTHVTQGRNTALPTWMIWAGNTLHQPTWAIHADAHVPASLLQDLTFELAEGQGRRRAPNTSQRTLQITTQQKAPARPVPLPRATPHRTR
ncbi:DUF317 domain-containing protein [Streptomyces sp. NPDC093589]|uniref:DUF317 domain-containing protein n=1 Tax=Streptomyces sp. NPDC093589 TaxID=3366043 RepID=UPI00382638F5